MNAVTCGLMGCSTGLWGAPAREFLPARPLIPSFLLQVACSVMVTVPMPIVGFIMRLHVVVMVLMVICRTFIAG